MSIEDFRLQRAIAEKVLAEVAHPDFTHVNSLGYQICFRPHPDVLIARLSR